MAVAPLIGEGLIVRRVVVRSADVVFVKGVLEASEGLGAMFAQTGGDLVIATPRSRVAELDALLADLARELGVSVAGDPEDCPDG